MTDRFPGRVLCDVKRDIGRSSSSRFKKINFTHPSTSSKFQKILEVIKETFQESRDHSSNSTMTQVFSKLSLCIRSKKLNDTKSTQ